MRRGGALFRIVVGGMLMVVGSRGRAQTMPDTYGEALSYLGKKGDFKDQVLKVSIPRNDLHVTVAGVATPTPFGFGGWVAMTKGSRGEDVMMGDLVLLQEEVNPVMSALLDNGLEVTALHNHFFWDEPHIFYMHVHGHGKAMDIAKRLKPALDLIGHVPGVRGTGDAPSRKPDSASRAEPSAGTLNTQSLSQIVGHTGEQLGAVYKITVGRDDVRLHDMGAVINSRMGLNTWAAFVGSDDHAAVAGDVAMLENEVTSVLQALRHNGLGVVAIHHHMTEARPMMIFLHYWGTGRADDLARGFRAALDQLGHTVTHAGMGH